MGKKGNKSLFVIFFVFCLIASNGCTTKKTKEDVVTLAFWSDNFNRTFAQRIVDYYNNHWNPKIPVEFFPIEATNYTTKLLTIIAGGSPPDIMLLMPDEVSDFASRGVLLELTPFTESDLEFTKIKENSWHELWEIGKFNEKVFGMPIWTNSIAIFYNKTLFNERGVSYPDETWDWNTFLDAAKRLTKDIDKDGRVDQFGFEGFPLRIDPWCLYIIIRQNGGELFNRNRSKSLVSSPETIEAVQWVIDLAEKYHVVPTRSEILTGQFGQGGTAFFLSGRIAMIWGGRWVILPLTNAKNLKFEWSVAPFFHQKNRVMASAPVLLSISKKTKYPKECWKFLKFMMDEEGQKIIINDRSDISILKYFAYSPEYLNRFSRPKENEIFILELKHSKPYPYVLYQKSWMDEATQWLEKASVGNISVMEACQQIDRRYEEMVSGGQIKP